MVSIDQHNQKLLAAHAKHVITPTGGAIKDARHLLQHVVAGVVPMSIVDRFEVVDIYH